MKAHLGLTLVAVAALAAGAAFAKSPGPRAAAPQEPSAMDRLVALEKQVVDLKAELAALRKAPSQASPVAGQPTPEQYADLRRQMDEVLAYLEAQAQSAEALSAALEDSRVLGFTFGINPDSRIVMLDGFGQFTTTLQTNVPSLVPPIVEPAQK